MQTTHFEDTDMCTPLGVPISTIVLQREKETKYSTAVDSASLNNFNKQITGNSCAGQKENYTRPMIRFVQL
jgi:hypothetical protein